MDSESLYKLRCTLLGHSADVRGVAAGSSNGDTEFIVTGSRDRTTKVWIPTVEGGGSEFEQFQTCEGHTNFVSCVHVIPPTEKHPDGLVLSGSHDHTILAFELGKHQPVFRLAGHKGTVCSIGGTGDSLIVSGSWDQSAKVWSEQTNIATLVGHEAAVWAVATVPGPDHKILTGSADKTIRLWVDYQPVLHFLGHTDCVRALAVVDSDRFLSGSNDASIRMWSISKGETLETFYGHSNFIYSICLLPGEGNFVSVGEDRTLRVWKKNETKQVIFHPATCVWSVTTFKNGDIATGCSDGTVRVFTSDPARMGSPEVLTAFEEEVAKSVVAAQQELGGMKVSELPGPEALLTEGKEDGATIMVREGDKIGCFSWSVGEQKWTKIGDVVGASGATQGTSGRVLFEGKEYDYVFSVDLDEKGTLKLPYNVTEDPWFAAQKFIHKHELSQMFLDQVAKFIIDNTKGVEIGTAASSSDYVDPFTGGNRYVPGSSGGSHAQVSGGGGGGLDPFTGSGAYTTSSARATSSTVELNNASSGPCFPVKDFVRFSSPPNYDALTKKLKEIISDLGPEAGFGEEGINTLLDIGRNAVWNENVNLYVKTCLVNWPADKIFPVLDLLRLGVLNASFAFKFFASLRFTEEFPSKFLVQNSPVNEMLTLRLFSNSFGPLTDSLAESKHVILSQLLGNFAKTKQNEIAASTLLLNYSIVVSGLHDGMNQNCTVESQSEVLMALHALLDLVDDPEAVFRTLVAVGNLVHSNEAMATLFKNLVGPSTLDHLKEKGGRSAKISNCVAQLKTKLGC